MSNLRCFLDSHYSQDVYLFWTQTAEEMDVYKLESILHPTGVEHVRKQGIQDVLNSARHML